MDERVEIALKGNEFKRVMENSFGYIKKEYDLKKVDIEVLFYLSICKGQNTPTDIHMRLKLNKGHISQAIDTLMKKGYIIALPDVEDRRSMHYSVSDKANAVIHDIEVEKHKFDEEIFAGISDEEIAIYKKITYKIIDNINKMV